jgi:hypothetical protein
MLFKNRAKKVKDLIKTLDLSRFAKFLILATVLSLLLSFAEYYLRDFSFFKFFYHLAPALPTDSFYWLFSSLAQAMAALFGIGGLFAAYFMQAINSSLAEEVKRAEWDMGISGSVLWDASKVLKELKRAAAAEVHTQNQDMRQNELRRKEVAGFHVIEMESILAQKGKSIRSFKSVSVIMTLLIAFSAIAIPFSHKLCSLVFGLLFATVLLILAILGLFKMLRFILLVVEGPQIQSSQD